MTKLKKVPKRYIIIPALVFLILLGSFFYIMIAARTYTKLVYVSDTPIDSKTTYVTVENPDVVTADYECVQQNDFYYCYLKAEYAGLGKTEVVFHYQDENDKPSESISVLETTVLGTIDEDATMNFNGQEILFPAFILIVLLTSLFFLGTLVGKIRKGEFSYSMVALGGVLLYLLGMMFIMLGYSLISFDSLSFTFSNLRTMIIATGMFFPILTSPVLFILAVALSISNIWLVRHEGFRLMNLLGILLSLVIFAGYVAMIISSLKTDYSGKEGDIFNLLENFHLVITIFVFYAFSYMECMLLSTMLCAVTSTLYIPPHDRDYIIILGCAIRSDGSPTPLLRGRIDRAIAFEREQFSDTGKHAVFVPSGGQGSDEVISEAESMKRYLLEQGVPEEQIILEDKSVNTLQNMSFSEKVIAHDCGDIEKAKIAFSTTNYHVFRGYTLAKKLGMKVLGLSAKTKPYFYPNAFVREFIGLLYEQKWRHLLLLALIALMCVVFVILSYL